MAVLPGLGLVPVVRVIPHFDRFGRRIPDVALRGLGHGDDPALLVGIDEETALVGGMDGWQADAAGPGNAWQVLGRQSTWLLGPGGRTRVAAGESVVLPVPAAA